MRIVAIIAVILLLTACTAPPNTESNTVSANQTVQEEKHSESGVYQCNGSVSPKNYYVRNFVTGLDDENKTYSDGDNCVDHLFATDKADDLASRDYTGDQLIRLRGVPSGRYLREVYCDERGGIASEEYRCPYGCEQGVCVSVSAEEREDYLRNLTMSQQDEIIDLQNQLALQHYETEKLRREIQSTMISKDEYYQDMKAFQEYFWQNAHKFVECSEAGGVWKEFGSGCADFCGAGNVCTAAITPSCDCGPTRCWNGTACV